MITRITAIALTAILFLVQTATAQITSAPRFVQIRSINLTTSVLELFNTGTSSQSLAGWRFCTHDEDQVRRYSATAGLNSFTLAGGQSLFVHFNNDADPTDVQQVNVSTIGGAFAQPLDAEGAYGAQIYFNSSFGNGASALMVWTTLPPMIAVTKRKVKFGSTRTIGLRSASTLK